MRENLSRPFPPACGMQPATTTFLPSESSSASFLRNAVSVGPFTVQELMTTTSASPSVLTRASPLSASRPFMTSLSAWFAEQPWVMTWTFTMVKNELLGSLKRFGQQESELTRDENDILQK